MSNTIEKKPKAVLWLESSLTVFHINHMALLSRALQEKGFEVSILTSEDTLKTFEDNGGKLTFDRHCTTDSEIDFGKDARFLVTLPSQTTYNQPGVEKVNISALRPFDFIGAKEIIDQRNEVIASAVEQEKPDAIVTSLWPGGYGPFDEEIGIMIDAAKAQNSKCKIYGLVNDIPYLDFDYNHCSKRSVQFEKLDKAFIRGDGSIPLERQIPFSDKALKTLSYVGHFVEPLPARTTIPDKDRKVLVTYGTRESNWTGDHYQDYFKSVLDAAPHTKLRDHPWELVIGPACSKWDFWRISREAKKVASKNNMKIQVRRGVPDKAFRQEIADAALRICQYDIFVLDEISSGVPALVTTGDIGRYTCGAGDGDTRLRNLRNIGAPIRYMDQYYIDSPGQVVSRIDSLSDLNPPQFSLPQDAPNKVADAIFTDYQLSHDTHTAGNGNTDPDSALSSVNRVTPQGDAPRRGHQHG